MLDDNECEQEAISVRLRCTYLHETLYRIGRGRCGKEIDRNRIGGPAVQIVNADLAIILDILLQQLHHNVSHSS